MSILYPLGTVNVTVPAGEKIAIGVFEEASADIYYQTGPGNNVPPSFYLSQTINNEQVLLGAFAADRVVQINAGNSPVYYEVGASPVISQYAPETILNGPTAGTAPLGLDCLISVIADAGTITVAQHRGTVLQQDASGGAVTMTTATAVDIIAAFPKLTVGNGIFQFVTSNHASNTSTITGGVGVTLVGSGAVTQLGGTFLLIKTAATTMSLVRVG